MKMMSSAKFLQKLFIVCVMNLTPLASFSAKIDIPECPSGTTRVFLPNPSKPQWAGCKDKAGLYQDLLIQFSDQLDVVRVASVKNSLRHGVEIRPGKTNFIEEKNYIQGHLHGFSYVFKSESILGRIWSKPISNEKWAWFRKTDSTESIAQKFTQLEPISKTEFNAGRLVRIQFGKTHYQFQVSADGRIFAKNHPEMKKLFFIDPETLWTLNAEDLKRALMPGFGSCKQYDGPIGRYVRHYDRALFKKQSTEKKQLEQLKMIRERFVNFCVPKDLIENLGTIECPPQLPSPRPPRFCVIPVSDHLRIPYKPSYFKNEFTYGRTPEEFTAIVLSKGGLSFLSDYEKESDVLELSPEIKIAVKKSHRGLIYKALIRDKNGKFVQPASSTTDQDWYDWSGVPGYSGL